MLNYLVNGPRVSPGLIELKSLGLVNLGFPVLLLLLFLMSARNRLLALPRLQRGLRVISPHIGYDLKSPDIRMKGVTSFLSPGDTVH
jgi:hypothetical protein